MGSKLAVITTLKGELGVTVDRFMMLSAQCSMTNCNEDSVWLCKPLERYGNLKRGNP